MTKSVRERYLARERMISNRLGGTVAETAYLVLATKVSWAKTDVEVHEAFFQFENQLITSYGLDSYTIARETINDMVDMGWI